MLMPGRVGPARPHCARGALPARALSLIAHPPRSPESAAPIALGSDVIKMYIETERESIPLGGGLRYSDVINVV